jgi:MFS family permease
MPAPLLQNSNFKLHWASVAIAQVGSFFTTIALPWLTLKTAHDNPIVLTTLLATSSFPNGFFILAGGNLADRFSPVRVLKLSRVSFVLVMSSLALLTWMAVVPLWLLYGYAALLGTLSAVALPASQALLPAILKPTELGSANGIVMGTLQVAQLMGPLLAGWVIWFCRRFSGVTQGNPDPASLAAAFALDAGLVLIATLLLFSMKVGTQPSRGACVLQLLTDGLRFCWRHTGIRLVLGYVALVSFFLQGPLLVGLPLLTRFRFGLYERALGGLYAMIGAGTILGICVALVSRPSARWLGAVVLSCDFVVGTSLHLLGRVSSIWTAGSLLCAMGAGLGVTMVAGTTWFQTRTPSEYMGRVMSFMMFAAQGLVPLSATLTGYLLDGSSVGRVMNGAGLAIVSVTLLGLALPRVRRMGDLPAYESAPPTVISSPDTLAVLAKYGKQGNE